MKPLSHHFKRESLRLLPLLVVAGLILIPDSSSAVVWFSLGITLLLTGVSHVQRKLLFPYVDLEAVYQKAAETSSGAAAVFASIVALLATLMYCATLLLH